MSFVKGLLIFITGAAAGIGGTYYYMKSIYEKKMEEKMTEELIKYKHDLKIEEYEKHLERMEEADKGYAEYRKQQEEKYKNSPDPREQNKVIDTHKTDYTKNNEEEEDESMPDYVEFIDTKPIEECRRDPYIITESEHYSGPQYYDFEEYNYILPNEDVIDDSDNILEDVNKILGYKNLEALESKKDGDYIYIRNEMYESDYCVTLIDWRNRK